MLVKSPTRDKLEELARGVPRYLNGPCLQKFRLRKDWFFFFAPELKCSSATVFYILSNGIIFNNPLQHRDAIEAVAAFSITSKNIRYGFRS